MATKKKSKTNNGEPRKFRKLPVKLSDKELVQRSTRLGELWEELENRREERNRISRSMKDIQTEADELVGVIRARQEHRDVEVAEELNGREINVIRLDTDEIVDTKTLSEEEAQDYLPFGGGEARA